ncbi:hypothetical protein ACHAXT_005682 [Thalassiosira profunda]
MKLSALLAAALLPGAPAQIADFDANLVNNPVTVVVGGDSPIGALGWTDGVCYAPIAAGVSGGDTLLFEYDAHNVYLMASAEHFHECDFSDAELLSQVGESPFEYVVPPEKVGEVLYFACQVGDHCAGGTQKLQVAVNAFFGNDAVRVAPPSTALLGNTKEECDAIQKSSGVVSEQDQIAASAVQSFCGEPILLEDEPADTYYRTCLSGPATLTPGGVINRLFVMQDPYPEDHRVLIGQRTFEFVAGDPDSAEGIRPVPVNELYVHHLGGSVVFGQGSEGIRQTDPDAPFPEPYSLFSGEDGNSMIFHLIDLREVDEWLACVECRCPVSEGTYLDALTQEGNITGGVNCCFNCTDLVGPTVDYRMRYNITYRELQEDDPPVSDVRMLTADISTAVDAVLEHDVPSWNFLKPDEISPDNPKHQRLVIEKPFNEIFKDEFFQQPYSGPDTVQLLRCVAHLHIASVEMWLENAETGERLCDGQPTYGEDPATDKGFLTAVSVTNFNPPKEFPADMMVRFVTDYDANIVHTGVMGYWFVFTAGDNQVTAQETALTVDLCLMDTCDATLLPEMDMTPFLTAVGKRQLQEEPAVDCVDSIAESPVCTFGGVCECEALVAAEETTDGCNGFYSTAFGQIEVRSVCANFCGCAVSAAVEEAALSSPPADEDCIDSLATHPACLMGNMCDCEEYVNAPESTGCGGVYESEWGNVPIDSVCNKYCGCNAVVEAPAPQAPPAAQVPAIGLGCTDELASNPACRFGGLCSCEEFVAGSEGCGGWYRSEQGDIEVNSVCASYCDACGDQSAEDLFNEAYGEAVELAMKRHCMYDTPECEAMLSNLYTCSSEAPGLDQANAFVRNFVTKMGQEAALASAKLGHPSNHVDSEDPSVEYCDGTAPAKEECVDAITRHPVCNMGGLCNCEEFVSLPESTGCGGVYTSAFGNVPIDSVCNKFCGCALGQSSFMDHSVKGSCTFDSPFNGASCIQFNGDVWTTDTMAARCAEENEGTWSSDGCGDAPGWCDVQLAVGQHEASAMALDAINTCGVNRLSCEAFYGGSFVAGEECLSDDGAGPNNSQDDIELVVDLSAAPKYGPALAIVLAVAALFV